MFLCRNKNNYPRIITKYSFLTIPLILTPKYNNVVTLKKKEGVSTPEFFTLEMYPLPLDWQEHNKVATSTVILNKEQKCNYANSVYS